MPDISRRSTAEWHAAGFITHPCAPPDARPAPGSKVKPGKAPAVLAEGTDDLWRGAKAHERSPAGRERQVVREDFERAYEAGANRGAEGYATPAVDIDCMNPAWAEKVARVAREVLRPAPMRTGKAPKVALLYRWAGPDEAEKARTTLSPKWRWRDEAGEMQAVEIIGAGLQLVVEGIHPDTGQPYSWDVHPVDAADAGLIPEITCEDLRRFYRALKAEVEAAGLEIEGSAPAAKNSVRKAPGELLSRDPEELYAAALAVMPFIEDRAEWIAHGHACKGAFGGPHAGLGFDLWMRQAELWPGEHSADVEAIWDGFNPTKAGAEQLARQVRRWGYAGPLTDLVSGFDALPDDGEADASPAPGAALVEDVPISADDGAPLADEPCLVDGLLPLAGPAMLYGASGAGKSFVSVHLAASVASGLRFFGRDVEPGAVLYVALEGRGGTFKRFRAWQRRHGLADALGVVVTGFPLNLLDRRSVSGLVARAKEWGEQLDRPVRLIVVDTFAAATGAGDENDSSTAKAASAALRRLSDETSALVLAVHHAGKDATRGARGHSSVAANMDTRLLIQPGTLMVERQRDLEGEGDRFGFRLESVVLGSGRHRRPITSAAVVECEAAEDATPLPKLGPNAEAALAALRELVAAAPDGAVTEAAFLAAAARVVSGATPKQRGQSARRALHALRKGRRIAARGGLVALHPGPTSWRFSVIDTEAA